MIFKRSLSHELLYTAIGAFTVLFGVVVAQRTTFLIGIAANGGIANNAINTLLSFSMLRFLPMILSLTIFLAVLLTLTRQHRDSEMVIWFSAGQGLTAWIKPVLSFATPVIVLIAFLSLFVTPWATNKSSDYKTQLKKQDELSTITPGVFKESKQANRVYFVEAFDKLGTNVKNVFIQSIQHQQLGVIVAAQGHRETMANHDHFLVLEQGRRYEGKPDSAEFSSTTFEKYAVRIESNEIAEPNVKVLQAMSSSELITQLNSSNIAELQGRIAVAISALILVLLAIPLSFVDPRSGRTSNVVMAVLTFFIYHNMINICQGWLIQGKLSPYIGIWPVHLIFLLLTVYLFYRRTLQLPLLPRLVK
jgi:lipopolysaccharide export system permease protein